MLAAWRSRPKIAGSGAGSIGQRHGSSDPDPYQNIHNTRLFLGAGREQAGGVGGQPQLRALPRPEDDVCLLRQAFKLNKYLCLGTGREQAGGVGGQPQLRALPRPGDDVRLLRQVFKLIKQLPAYLFYNKHAAQNLRTIVCMQPWWDYGSGSRAMLL